MDHTEEKRENLIQVDLKQIMEDSFLDYSMSVIVSRALPDVRDGLKPVHRRILYTMYENSLWPEKAYRKCADTVGAVLGRYHPHGTPPSTTRLSVWRRISPCAICSWTATATSVPWTAIPLLHTVIPRQG